MKRQHLSLAVVCLCSLAVLALALPRTLRAEDEKSATPTIEERVALLEKRLALLEKIAMTPPALHSYLKHEAADLAGKEKAKDFQAAIDRAERASTVEDLKRAYRDAADLLERQNRALGKICPQHCKDEYDKCSAECQDKSCLTRCFGHYVLCCRPPK